MDPLHKIAVSSMSIGEFEELTPLLGGRASVVVGSVATPADVARTTADADGVIVALQPMTAAHIAAFGDRVRVIGRAGVGLDTVDLDAAAERGVAVIHEPGFATAEVADHAAALLLTIARQVVAADRAVRKGWVTSLELGRVVELATSTLGVVGTGRIGSALIERMRPFVSRIVVFDPFASEVPAGVEVAADLHALLGVSDLVSLHVPLSPENRHLIGAGELAAMKPDAMLVNVSRGGLVDEAALAAALTSGQLAAAGIDVFSSEPLPDASPLRQAPNIVLTPHIAGYSEGAFERLARWVIEDLLAHFGGDTPVHGRYAVPPRSNG